MSKTIEEMEFGEGPEWVLVTDSQDVDSTGDSIGIYKLSCIYDSLFVKVGDGDYDEIWGFNGIPYLTKSMDQIYPEVPEELLQNSISYDNNISG